MDRLPDLSSLSHDEKDALIHALWAQVQALTAQVTTLAARVVKLEARLGVPPKTELWPKLGDGGLREAAYRGG
jgi:transposase